MDSQQSLIVGKRMENSPSVKNPSNKVFNNNFKVGENISITERSFALHDEAVISTEGRRECFSRI